MGFDMKIKVNVVCLFKKRVFIKLDLKNHKKWNFKHVFSKKFVIIITIDTLLDTKLFEMVQELNE